MKSAEYAGNLRHSAAISMLGAVKILYFLSHVKHIYTPIRVEVNSPMKLVEVFNAHSHQDLRYGVFSRDRRRAIVYART